MNCRLSGKQPEYGNAGCGSDVDVSVGDHGCAEVRRRAKLIPGARLISVVVLARKHRGVECVEHGRNRVRYRPNNMAGIAVCRYRWGCAGVREADGGQTRRSAGHECIGKRKRPHVVARSPEVNSAVEVSWRGMFAMRQGAGQQLV
jgi:hypothetical protein